MPSGYLLRTATPEDAPAYASLFAASFAEFGDIQPFGQLLEKSLPAGFFVVELLRTGEMIASAAAAVYPSERHPEGAVLHWAMVHAAHRGKGLGMLVIAAATKRLAESGFSHSYLRTQAYRDAAISIYFKLGWKPLLYSDEMPDRWRYVCGRLGVDFTPENWRASPL